MSLLCHIPLYIKGRNFLLIKPQQRMKENESVGETSYRTLQRPVSLDYIIVLLGPSDLYTGRSA